MTKEEILERLAAIGREVSWLYGELSEEVCETDSRTWLRFVKDDTRGNSEVKKMPRKSWTFRARRRQQNKLTV